MSPPPEKMVSSTRPAMGPVDLFFSWNSDGGQGCLPAHQVKALDATTGVDATTGWHPTRSIRC